ncbi:MAG: hypothetical protein LBC14_04605, partial [Desulfovibrio sp.]|nr:hypothetical protein [Desulfovibrio sp.]
MSQALSKSVRVIVPAEEDVKNIGYADEQNNDIAVEFITAAGDAAARRYDDTFVGFEDEILKRRSIAVGDGILPQGFPDELPKSGGIGHYDDSTGSVISGIKSMNAANNLESNIEEYTAGSTLERADGFMV